MQYIGACASILRARLSNRHKPRQWIPEVAYESEAAFNRAFKKFDGIPPGVLAQATPKR
jgi:AraC-like DNA-binding protein